MVPRTLASRDPLLLTQLYAITTRATDISIGSALSRGKFIIATAQEKLAGFDQSRAFICGH